MNHADIAYLTATDIRKRIADGRFTVREVVGTLETRIRELDWAGPNVRSVIEINLEAEDIAAERGTQIAQGAQLPPLHGIPVLLKDNIDTADAMHTTAGSLALMDSTPARDATVAQLLRDAGAVITGKTNMSEWANFRGDQSSSGWSGRGGLTRNPHSLAHTASGSSSGSAAAVAAGLAPIAIGTETDGSIISPASACGVVGVKPTVGLTSRAGVIPIASSQDSVGVFARSVKDAAIALTAISGVDDRDPATRAGAHLEDIDFAANLSASALEGVRLGVPANCGYRGYSTAAEKVFEACLTRLTDLGAVIVTDCDLPNEDAYREEPGEMQRLLWEFRKDLNAYLAERNDPEILSLADVIAFNNEHADDELRWFGQELMERSEASAGISDEELAALNKKLNTLSRENGIDHVLREHGLDALIAPSKSPATTIDLVNGEQYRGSVSMVSAIAGYPIVTVPAGMVHGLPIGLSFFGTAWSDERLLQLAYAWEQHTRMFRQPTFAADITSVSGTLPGELP